MSAANDPLQDEQQVIEHAKKGDHAAFRTLMDRYLRQAYNLAHRFSGEHETVEDIVQEAFLKVHANLHSFRGESAFATWLHRIVVNTALTYKRRSKANHTAADEAADEGTDATHHTIYMQEQREHIERALHELPTLQRAVVILRHLNGLSTRQVSEILHCSEGTVKTHLFRGLKSMRKRLGHLEEGLA